MAGGITFDGVWKKFRRGEHHDSLRDLLPAIASRALRRRPAGELDDREFWAVADVSFEVRTGEALGIIGPNGAGKSTVLKLLTRILRAERGHCAVRGRTGALIEVAAGFHPDLTGRENIYLQGAIVGMKRAEIARKFDQIVEFAGIGEFIDTPVKRFSSGMNARLGFAIAANLEPDVLIVDEVLSVGDARFQARCITRMRELLARGVPLVFVSHNLPAVAELCTKAILLSHGRVVYTGSASETVQRYGAEIATSLDETARPDSDIWTTSVQVLNGNDAPADVLRSGCRTVVRIGYATRRPVHNPGFAVDIHRADGIYCFGISTWSDRQDLGVLHGAGFVDLEIDPLQLTGGCYNLSVGIHRPGTPGTGGAISLYDLRQYIHPFTVATDRGDLGVACLEHAWRHHPAKEAAAS